MATTSYSFNLIRSSVTLNTFTTGDQNKPTVTALNDGGWFAAWANDLDSISGATYDQAGVVRNNSSTALNISTSGNQYDAQLATLTGGNSVLVYTDESTGTARILAERISSNKSVIGSEIVVSAGNDGDAQTNADVARLADGGFVVVWEDTDSVNDHDIQRAVYNADGSVRAANSAINGSSSDDRDVHVAGLTGGGFVTVWARTDHNNSNATSILAQLYDATGGKVGSVVTIDAAGSLNDQPEIVGLNNGGFAVAYRNNSLAGGADASDIALSVFNADGVFQNALYVNQGSAGSGKSQVDPAITLLSNGYIAVGWTNDDATATNRNTDIAFYTPTGAFVFNDSLVFANSEDQFSLAGLQHGRFAAVGQSAAGDGDGNGIKGAVLDLTRTVVGDGTSERFVSDSLVDHFTGNGGSDTFVFALNNGADNITDFTRNVDKIDLTGRPDVHNLLDIQSRASQIGSNTVIDFGGGDSLTLNNFTKSTLTSSDFIFSHFDQVTYQLSAFGANPAQGGWANNNIYPRHVADVNGDGFADIVGFSGPGVQVALGNSAGGFANPIGSIQYYGANPSAGGWSDDNIYTRELADVNGDGKADIVGFSGQGVIVSLATSGGQFGSPTLTFTQFGANAEAGGWSNDNIYHRELADVNGDGKADIVGFGGAGAYVALATGGGNFANPILGTTAFGANPEAGGWANDTVYHRELADVNGDGKADIVGFGDSAVYVALSTGDGTFGAAFNALNFFGAAPAAGGWANMNSFPRHLADVNGDGRADIVGFGGGNVYVAEGRADGKFNGPTSDLAFFGNTAAAGGWATDNAYPRVLADVNGDHHADIVGFGGNGVYVAQAAHAFDLV